MKQRIFIAINLPLEIKQELWQIQKKFKKWPVKLVPVENLHITLAFLGNLWPQEIEELKQTIFRVGDRFKKFEIRLTKVCSAKNRLIWVEAESPELIRLGEELTDRKFFSSHITLARGQGKIQKNINLNFIAQSIDIMKSELRPQGSKYTIIWQYELKQD